MKVLLYSRESFCRRLDITEMRLKKLMRDHREIFAKVPKMSKDFRFDWYTWAPIVKKLLPQAAEGTRARELPPASAEIDDEAPTASSTEVITYGESRATRELYSARTAKLDYLRRSGKLVEVDAVRRAWQNIAISVQKAVLAVPDRVAPLCVGENDLVQIRNKMRSELLYALKNLSFSIQSENAAVAPETETNTESGATTTLVAKVNKNGGGRKKKVDSL